MLVFAPVLGCIAQWRDCCVEVYYFREELEQWMTDGVTMETVEDGRNVVGSATWTAFSVILSWSKSGSVIKGEAEYDLLRPRRAPHRFPLVRN